MFLARLPDGAKQAQVYEITTDDVRQRGVTAWRYEPHKPGTSLEIPGGIVAVGQTKHSALIRLRSLQFAEMYPDRVARAARPPMSAAQIRLTA